MQATITKDQAAAIVRMAESLTEFNRGVLTMLGQEQLAVSHAFARQDVEQLLEQRDALDTSDLQDLTATLNPEAQAVQDKLDIAVLRMHETWKPIQAIIDRAQAAIDAADPMGMRY